MSVTQHRKDRERAQREEMILDHAGRLLLRDGFQNLNLDELAKAIEYSKGTIYLHFKTKEDLVLAIATRVARERADLFERASAFSGKTRERMRAIGFASCHFAVIHPDYFNLEMLLKSPSFWEKASMERQRTFGLQAAKLFHCVNSIAQQAVIQQDLPPDTRSQDVTLSLIATTIGTHIMIMQPEIQVLCAIDEPIAAVRRNQDILCDGWNWKPLAKDWNYRATDRRIKNEVFPEAKWFKPG